MRVDDGALAIGALVELTHAMLAKKGQIVDDFLQVFTGPHVFPLARVRTACHDRGFYFIRLLFAIKIPSQKVKNRTAFGRHGRMRPWLHGND